MKRWLMNGMTGTLALSVALAAGGAANATTRGASAQRHSPAGPRPSAYRTASARTDAIEASTSRPGRTRTTTVVGSHTITRSGATFSANGTAQPPVIAQNSAKLLLTGCVVRTAAAGTGAVDGTGTNTAVLAKSPSLVALNGCAITTEGASGVVSVGQGSFVRVANSTIRTNAASPQTNGASAQTNPPSGVSNQLNGAHGVVAATDGHVALDNANVRTTGPHAAALVAASGGTVIAHDGSMSADGSPVIRSAGLVQAFGVKGIASGAHAAIIAGHGTIDAIDTELTGSNGGVLLIGSLPGTAVGPTPSERLAVVTPEPADTALADTALADITTHTAPAGTTADAVAADQATLALTRYPSQAAANPATCNLTGGSLTAMAGPAFDVRRTTAKVAVRSAVVVGGTDVVSGSSAPGRASVSGTASVTDPDASGTASLTGAEVTGASGTSADVAGADATGASGTSADATGASDSGRASATRASRVLIRVADGGRLAFSASGGVLSGDVIGHGATSLTLRNGAALAGAVDGAALDLDSSSTWSVTGPSTLTALTGVAIVDGTIPAITGNGHDVSYDPELAANDWLDGKTYPLAGSGALRPRPTA